MNGIYTQRITQLNGCYFRTMLYTKSSDLTKNWTTENILLDIETN